MPACPSCAKDVLDIDVRCPHCGVALGATGAHAMLGTVMLGQYELVDVLGQGGMSVVFKGKHKMTDQEVALKILPPELAAHSQVKSRFLDEAKALAALDHPNIVHLYNFGQENGSFVLAMQYVQGQTWERMILEAERLDWRPSCRIAIDVLRALEYAHSRGIVHRDMKPSNVLVRAHDAAATVMDFGIAKMTTSTRLTATGQTMGTVRYMSPEQVRGQEVDLRTDLYSLGATLYESLYGDTPFDGSTHFEIMTKHLSEVPKRPSDRGVPVPPAVEDAVMRSLAKKPEDRFEDAREMRKVLEAALRDGDLGLVETQRLNREVLGDLRPTIKPGARVATASASSLADALEPGTGPVPKRRGNALWLGLGLLVLGGGTATALLLMRDRGAPDTRYKPRITEISGVTPVAGITLGSLTIETSGKLPVAEVGEVFTATVARLREFAADRQLTFPEPIVLQEIVTVPQASFCERSAYPGGEVPRNCATLLAQSVIGNATGARRLLILDDPGKLARAMEIGVADAVCVFEPNVARVTSICQMTEAFVKPAAPE